VNRVIEAEIKYRQERHANTDLVEEEKLEVSENE